MDRMMSLKIIFAVLVFMAPAVSAHAECYNEDTCFKDYVTNNGENLVIAVNRDTDVVEQYWSDKNQTWLKPTEEEQRGIQRLYNKKVQLREMQGSLDQMHNQTWYNTDQNMSQRQR